VLYNLISDLVGGVEITVLEETYNTVRVQQAPPARVAPALYRNTGNGAPVPPGQQPTGRSQPVNAGAEATAPRR